MTASDVTNKTARPEFSGPVWTKTASVAGVPGPFEGSARPGRQTARSISNGQQLKDDNNNNNNDDNDNDSDETEETESSDSSRDDAEPRPADKHQPAPGAVEEGAEARLSLTSMDPELLTELKKMIKDEFQQLQSTGSQEDEGSVRDDPPPHQPPQATKAVRSSQASLPGPAQHASGDDASPRSPGSPKTTITAATTPSEPNTTRRVPTSLAESTPARQPSSSPSAATSPRSSRIRFSDLGRISELQQKSGSRGEGNTGGPRGSSRDGYVADSGVVQKAWGLLFDAEGYPTGRLEQVLRGLADYIVEEFLPRRSIVITPSKLAAFYSQHRIRSEVYPLALLFRGPLRNSSVEGWYERIANLYQDLDCQYHLVQAGDSKSRPEVPALTPRGFAQWLTTNILAHPEEEARRLESVFSTLPIDAEDPAGGKPERLPKFLPRVILPTEHDRRLRRLLRDAMVDFLDEEGDEPSTLSAAAAARGGPSEPRSRTQHPLQQLGPAGALLLHRPLPEKRYSAAATVPISPTAGSPKAEKGSLPTIVQRQRSLRGPRSSTLDILPRRESYPPGQGMGGGAVGSSSSGSAAGVGVTVTEFELERGGAVEPSSPLFSTSASRRRAQKTSVYVPSSLSSSVIGGRRSAHELTSEGSSRRVTRRRSSSRSPPARRSRPASMVVGAYDDGDGRGPTWDEYLKSAAKGSRKR